MDYQQGIEAMAQGYYVNGYNAGVMYAAAIARELLQAVVIAWLVWKVTRKAQ